MTAERESMTLQEMDAPALGSSRLPSSLRSVKSSNEGVPPVVVHVSADMGQLVQQAEPEIVDSVVAQSEADHRCAITEPECHPVEIGLWQVLFDHQWNAMLGQQFLRQPRAGFGPAQPRDLRQEFQGYGATLIVRLRAILVGSCKDLPAPRLEGMGVHFGIRTNMVVLSVERSACDIQPACAIDQVSHDPVSGSGQIGPVRNPAHLAIDLTGNRLHSISASGSSRSGWHGIIGLLRQSVYGRLAGYEDVNDADRLGRDPAMRWIVGGRAVERGGASTSQMGRFETELLATNDNLAALADLLGIWIDQVNERKPPKIIVLDMDSSVSPTYGDQEGTAYNGHFGCTCYHPLFVFNQFGDLERCALRPGNVHSAHEWRDVLDPVVARYRNKTLRRYFRGDAAFASPEVYEFLEAEGFKDAIRLPANKVLHDSIAHLLKRPVGRPPKEVRRYYANFSYRAGSWTEPRRVVAKVEWHSGELYPRVGFIVTNLSRPAERVVAFYNQRGTAEQWIKEGKNAIKWTRLSCRSLRNNAVRLQLHALAYNLGNFMRTLRCPMPWSNGR